MAIQGRKNDKEALRAARGIHHSATEKEVTAERAFLKELQGGCRVPVGVSTKTVKGKFHMTAAVFSVEDDGWVKGEVVSVPAKAIASSKKLARILLKNGAGSFLKTARAGAVR